jgi:hypothetical protein
MGDKNYAKYKRDFEAFLNEVGNKGSAWRYMEQLEDMLPDIAEQYFDFIPYELYNTTK